MSVNNQRKITDIRIQHWPTSLNRDGRYNLPYNEHLLSMLPKIHMTTEQTDKDHEIQLLKVLEQS